jgi:uracil-DNA glycosylase
MLTVVDPKAVVLMGATAASLAGIKSVSAWRGKRIDLELLMPDDQIRVWPAVCTWHPSYVLRCGSDPAVFAEVVSDIQKVWKVAHAA